MSNILVYVVAILAVCLIAKLFSAPIKIVVKLLINALVGGIALIIINWLGGFIGFDGIPLNFVTAIITGALGVPGIVILFIISMF